MNGASTLLVMPATSEPGQSRLLAACADFKELRGTLCLGLRLLDPYLRLIGPFEIRFCSRGRSAARVETRGYAPVFRRGADLQRRCRLR